MQGHRTLIDQHIYRAFAVTNSIQVLHYALWQALNARPRRGPACLLRSGSGVGASCNGAMGPAGTKMHNHN